MHREGDVGKAGRSPGSSASPWGLPRAKTVELWNPFCLRQEQKTSPAGCIPPAFPFLGSSFSLLCIPSTRFLRRRSQLCLLCTALTTSTAASSPPSVSNGAGDSSGSPPKINPNHRSHLSLGKSSCEIPVRRRATNVSHPSPLFPPTQIKRAEEPSTGRTIRALSIPSPSSCGTRGATGSSSPPNRSSRPPTRRGWR